MLETCGYCKYVKLDVENDGGITAYCRRYPPTQWKKDRTADFPEVHPMLDWCGEFVQGGQDFSQFQKNVIEWQKDKV
jgi:hypothetical protein